MGEAKRRAPRRRSGRWTTLGAGVRLASDLGEEDPVWARMRAWAERLPDGTVFTGLTAAAAYDLWLPPLPPEHPVEIAVPVGARVRRPQVVVSRHPLPPHSHGIDGVRIATVTETVLAASRRLGLLDLVVLTGQSTGIVASTRATAGATPASLRRATSDTATSRRTSASAPR